MGMTAAVRSAGVLSCLLLASCVTSVGKWTYPSGRYATTTSPKPADASIAVTPLLDVRGPKNTSYMTWYYIPMFPAGWTQFDRPEATVQGQDTTQYLATPCEDLAQSLAIELRRQGLVREATYAGDFRVLPAATHVLRGRLRSFYVEEERWSYGLSFYSPILWSLGLPMGSSRNGFCADLELTDAKDGRVVWKESIYDADDHIEGYYYGPEWYRFSWMWERRLREKLGSLAKALGAEPAPLPPALAEELRTAPPALLPLRLGVE
jgi:hypothetical protein